MQRRGFSVHSWPAGGDPEHEEHAQGPGHGAQPGPGVTAFVEADDPAEVDPQTCGAGDSEENVRAPLGEVAQGGGFGGQLSTGEKVGGAGVGGGRIANWWF